MKKSFFGKKLMYILPFFLGMFLFVGCDKNDEDDNNKVMYGNYQGKSSTYFSIPNEEEIEEQVSGLIKSEVKVKVNKNGIFFEDFPIEDILKLRWSVNGTFENPKSSPYTLKYDILSSSDEYRKELKLNPEPLTVSYKNEEDEELTLEIGLKETENGRYEKDNLTLKLEITHVTLNGISDALGIPPFYISFDWKK